MLVFVMIFPVGDVWFECVVDWLIVET